MTPSYEDLQHKVAVLSDRVKELEGRKRVVALRTVLKLRPQQAEILAMLEAQADVTRDAIYGTVFERPNGDGPELKIIDVSVSKTRKALRSMGAPEGIIPIFGYGYRLTPELRAWIGEHVPA